MKLVDFGLLADENIHPEVVAFLRQQGLDVIAAREQALIGASDVALIKAATGQDRLILTHDRDFGRLAVAALKPITGIIFLRPGHIDPSFTIGSLRALLDTELALDPPFVLVAERLKSELRIRLRKL